MHLISVQTHNVRVQYTHVYIVHTAPTGIHSSTHSTDLNASIWLAREGRGREEVDNLVAFWRGDLLTAAVTFLFFKEEDLLLLTLPLGSSNTALHYCGS